MKTKYYYAIRTDFHGSQSVARFTSQADRDDFCREFGVPVIDRKMGACWDTGKQAAESITAADHRVRSAIREDFWINDDFSLQTYEGEVIRTLSYERAV